MKLTRNDKIMILGVILILGAHGITQFYNGLLISFAQVEETAEQIALAFEVNPLAMSIMIGSKNLGILFSFFIIPSLILGFYYMARTKKIKTDPVSLEFISVIFLCMATMIFLNDLFFIIGVLIRGVL